jgi:hypothetical protein
MKNIKAGQLFRSTNIYYRDYDFEPVPLNTIVMVIDLENIAGNVSYLLGEHMCKMDATSFLDMFVRVDT